MRLLPALTAVTLTALAVVGPAVPAAATHARPATGTAVTAPARPPGPATAGPARLESRACPVTMPAGTDCGFLVVPQRRDVPDGRLIKVGYAVHRSAAAERKPDPVVYTSGGPGSTSMQLTGFLAASPFGRDRDVVTLEQRGSRYSEPHLNCPEMARAILDGLTRPGRDTAETDALTVAGRDCRNRLAAEGVDLRGYTTTEIAADVGDLRVALGYPTWNLMGVSYSTRSMLVAAAADPAGTRAVVLDSFLPAETNPYDATAANLSATLDRLEPGLSDRLDRVARRLNGAPVRVPVTDPLDGRTRTLHLTGDDVASLLAEGMQDADVVTTVPPLVHALEDERDDLLHPLGQVAADTLTSHDIGVYYAVNCQDEVPFNTFPPTPGLRPLFADYDPAICRGLDLPASPAATTPAVPAPVLVLGGTFDAATPVADARTGAARLPRATVVEFTGVAHAVFLGSRCGRETIAAFLSDPADPRTPCDPAASPYRTLRAGDRYVTARPYAVVDDPWWTALPPAALALGAVLAMVGGLIRHRWVLAAGGAVPAALLGIAIWDVLAVSEANPASLMVGVPWLAAWCLMLAGVAAVIGGMATVRRGVLPAVLAATGVAHLVWWLTG
jgi:pimeloyl-ACP methyl ester carboxylesterase